jgi:NAD(P)-dependent dehydrogenase (short-subunit alcohol dehydrogenase family)
LAGKFAIVTGGSDGIGLGIAQAFARSGADLYLVARNAAKLERAASELRSFGTRVDVQALDLGSADAPGALASAVERLQRTVDVLVNNAGSGAFTPFDKVTREEYDRGVALNMTAPFFLTQALLPLMRRPGASVINISSYFARKMLPGRPSSVYSMTKGALDALTRAMAMELAAYAIRVNAIAPGTVDTDLRRRTIANLPEQQQRDIADLARRSYPLGRIGRVEDLGGIAVHLASDESQWTTGAVIHVDGGLTIN